jgi:ppGpp synthetase/RelA/SpoT-type nucleotidyltranferase
LANQAYENQKVLLRYSKKSIDKAARNIRYGCVYLDREDSIDKIQNFREIHMYPLMLIKNHLARTAKKVNDNIVIARRLKRLPTIINKLERPTLDGNQNNAIKLTRMQDIGGCRAIVKNIAELKSLQERLELSKSVHQIIHKSDYLLPKESGYGGVHLIYSCFNEDLSENNWKKTKIEVQLRTELHHAWATSLEIIDTLEKIELKTSLVGHDKWRRFFKVAGILVAHDEGASVLNENDLIRYQEELNQLEMELRAIGKLLQFSLAIKAATGHSKQLLSRRDLGMCLVTIKNNEFDIAPFVKKGDVSIKLNTELFKVSESQLALKELNESEKDKSIIMSVLLATTDAKNLKKAYPNYFGSTENFRRFIKKHKKSAENQVLASL